MRKIWKNKEPDVNLSQKLASELGIPLLVAQLLVNRRITDVETAEEFLHPKLSNLHPPSEMKGMSDAADRIKRAVSSGEKITIYGDYDVDGITAVSMLMPCLKRLGAEVDYYIPNRLDEGYGLSQDGVAELKNNGCKLMITVDCGINATEAVQAANDAGIDVIITDHHEPGEKLPPALVTLDPKLADCGYPFGNLAGVGVAFKLAQALMGDEEFLWNQLDLVALGTIADVVPLVGENRIIAKYGLAVLNKMERAGIRALCEVSNVKAGGVSGGTVGFRLGPRINAAGRIDTAHSAVRLLTTDSYEEALEIAQKLDAVNKERQDIEKEILIAARRQVQKFDLSQEKGLVLADEGWHPGVVGIVASRIQEQYYRPTIIICLEGDQGRGSARSIPEFDIFAGLKKCSHLLEKFGGHKAAAGLSIAKQNVGKFRKEFSRVVAETLKPDDLKPKVLIDIDAAMSGLTMEVVEQLTLLEPHGLGNPRPMLSLKKLALRGVPRIVGKTGAHLQMTVSDGQNSLKGIAFYKSEMERELYDEDVILDLACRPFVNLWNDRRSVELRVEEMVVHHHDAPDVMAASAEIMALSQIKIVDRRNIPDKRRHLRNILAQGEKLLLYVRDDAAVDQLQQIVSKHAARTKLGLCYHETPAGERDQMKEGLIEGELDAIVSCVPFDMPLPGLGHLVFCHPVSTREHFARCCAPAVEAEKPVRIHLIFNNKDVELLTATLNQQYPDRKTLANIYRKTKELFDGKGGSPVLLEEIAAAMSMDGNKEAIISNGIAVFEEISLIERQEMDGKSAVSLPTAPQEKRDLKESQRYADGDRIKSEWGKFSTFILRKTAADIRKMLLETIP